MKIVSDALEAIAVSMDLNYIRSMSETEADIFVHKLTAVNAKAGIIVYNGASDIATSFDGAMIYDTFDVQIYVVKKQPTVELSGSETDDELQVTKEWMNEIYSELNKVTAKDIEPYKATAVRMFTDVYIGHDVSIQIPFYNEGCTAP